MIFKSIILLIWRLQLIQLAMKSSFFVILKMAFVKSIKVTKAKESSYGGFQIDFIISGSQITFSGTTRKHFSPKARQAVIAEQQ